MACTLKQHLYVLHINRYSLRNKFNAFHAFISQLYLKPDVICLTKSWLATDEPFFHLPGFNFSNFPQTTGHSEGRIAVYVNANIQVTVYKASLDPTSFKF